MNANNKPTTICIETPLTFIVVGKPVPGATPSTMTSGIDFERDKHLLSHKPLRRPPPRNKPAQP